MRTIKERLEARSPLLGLSAHYGTPAIIETIGPHWDWVWIDIQHGRIDEKDVEHMVMACDLADAAAVVRVASNEAGAIERGRQSSPPSFPRSGIVPTAEDESSIAAAGNTWRTPTRTGC